MGQTLLQIRTNLVEQTGHGELVTDWDAADYSDNGMDFYINAGQRRLDDMFEFKNDSAWFYTMLTEGNSLITLNSARYIEEVWVVNPDSPKSRTRLERATEQWLREEYPDVPLSSIDTGTPLYWSNVVAGLPPTNFSDKMVRITAATQANPCVVTAAAHGFTNGTVVYINNVSGMTELNGNSYTVAGATTNTFQLSATNSSAYGAYTSGGTVATTATLALTDDYDWLLFGNYYLSSGVKIMPPPDGSYEVQILAKFFSRELTSDSHVSFWSWNYPELLIMAAKAEIEIQLHNNMERAASLEKMMDGRLRQIYYNLCSERTAGHHSQYRMV